MAAPKPPPQPSQRQSQPQQNGPRPTPPASRSRVTPQQGAPPTQEPDQAVLLLCLADEYFAAAAKISNQSDVYFKLIATGLGCLEAVLTNFKLPALREAQISLRYAQVLYDETENYDDAERVLTKAIDICERQNFTDLKYTLQLLLACVLYESKPKAAIKDLQTMLEDIEAYKHTAWEYAARYQLAVFYMSAPGVRDLHGAISNIEKMAETANRNRDLAVAAFGDVVCALIHLQTSNADAISASQQSLAKARALSTMEEVSSVDQIMTIMEFVDLACSIRESNLAQGDGKRRRMQDFWTGISERPGWKQDREMMFLPVQKTSLRGLQLQMGGLVGEKQGRYFLPFSWLDMDHAEACGFLLCAMSKAHKNAMDGGKAEAFIEHGLQRTRHSDASSQQKILTCRFLVELAFLKCQKGDWGEALKAVKSIVKLSNEVGDDFPTSLTCITHYLRGTIQQGLGDLDNALQIYQSPLFDLGQFMQDGAAPTHHRSNDSEAMTIRNIAIMAAMNRLLIINDRSHTQYNQAPAVIEQLNVLVKSSHDKNVQAAYTLIHSLITQTGILRSKQSLIAALNAAKAISNAQITALVLMTMHQKHFLGVTDEHATKCVKATSLQMKSWGSPMWMAVTAGVEAQAAELRGEAAEAERKRKEAQVKAEGLPEAIKARLGV